MLDPLLVEIDRVLAERIAAQGSAENEEALRLEESLIDFVEAAWPAIDPAEFQRSWVVEAMCDHLEAVADGQIKRLVINVPTRRLEEHPQRDYRYAFETECIAVAAAALVAVATPALAASKSGTVAPFDTDNDGTVDLDEAKKAASALFDKLDTDKDGTLDFKELHGRLTHLEFAAADRDNDGTLTKDEFLAVVEKRFGAADRDNDGKLSAAELKKGAGRSLSKLLSSP